MPAMAATRSLPIESEMLTAAFCLRCFDVCRFIAGVCLIFLVIAPIPEAVDVNENREEIP